MAGHEERVEASELGLLLDSNIEYAFASPEAGDAPSSCTGTSPGGGRTAGPPSPTSGRTRGRGPSGASRPSRSARNGSCSTSPCTPRGIAGSPSSGWSTSTRSVGGAGSTGRRFAPRRIGSALTDVLEISLRASGLSSRRRCPRAAPRAPCPGGSTLFPADAGSARHLAGRALPGAPVRPALGEAPLSRPGAPGADAGRAAPGPAARRAFGRSTIPCARCAWGGGGGSTSSAASDGGCRVA